MWEAPSEEAECVDQTLFFLFLNVRLSFPRITVPELCNGGRVIFWLLEIRQMWKNQKQFSGSRAPRRVPHVLVFQTEGGGAIILCQTYVGLREERKNSVATVRYENNIKWKSEGAVGDKKWNIFIFALQIPEFYWVGVWEGAGGVSGFTPLLYIQSIRMRGKTPSGSDWHCKIVFVLLDRHIQANPPRPHTSYLSVSILTGPTRTPAHRSGPANERGRLWKKKEEGEA